MRRFLASCFVVGALCFAAWMANRAITFAADDGGDSAALQADTALQLALRKKEAKAVAPLLDEQFSWTTDAGQTLMSAQFLKDAAAGKAVGDTEYNDVKARDYGRLAIVTGIGKRTGHEGTFFARIWVKRPAGWRLLTHQDTPILAKGSPSQQVAAGGKGTATATDCENPCHTVPYSPKTAEQKEVLKAYQAVETAVATHDEKTWAYHVADEFVGIGRRYLGMPDTKAGRVGQIGITSNRVILPKMLWGEAFVFGDAAIILADHQPVGEPPYRVIRVWINRDGRWQLFHRQETTIKGTPPARDKQD
ncbi:MAG TPA: nuclear transport factor 2 family protein [Candidatus Acidoferrales bacterium]|jgi:hypothetical protein|nr:nuclear transport factor 2 family protein [Candidatus Acidoferrales bacterium]